MYIATYLIIYDLYTQYKRMSISSPQLYNVRRIHFVKYKKRQHIFKTTLVFIYVYLCFFLFIIIYGFFIYVLYLCPVLGHSMSSYANALVDNLVFFLIRI